MQGESGHERDDMRIGKGFEFSTALSREKLVRLRLGPGASGKPFRLAFVIAECGVGTATTCFFASPAEPLLLFVA